MVELTRVIRFCIPFADGALPEDRHNTFAGTPAMHNLGAFYELQLRCRGEPDPVTGYLADIGDMDETVRRHGIPLIHDAVRTRPATPASHVLRAAFERVRDTLVAPVQSLSWRLTPTYTVTVEADAMHRFEMSQQFSFAAAHRLHSEQLSDDENRRVFGKCNNRHGHGHNYKLEVTVSADFGGENEPGFSLLDLERIVDATVVRRFDHTHLNLDLEEFNGRVPSVEHIAQVIHDLLVEPIRDAGAEIARVTVWETEKTSCTYPV
ncbi:MAG: 6-carboxytetrahydropterin synthase, partial [Phycisphaerales bacterium]|nr:6-carboxytetrahydropterin synthase [Phycisphaerales bacterium]